MRPFENKRIKLCALVGDYAVVDCFHGLFQGGGVQKHRSHVLFLHFKILLLPELCPGGRGLGLASFYAHSLNCIQCIPLYSNDPANGAPGVLAWEGPRPPRHRVLTADHFHDCDVARRPPQTDSSTRPFLSAVFFLLPERVATCDCGL